MKKHLLSILAIGLTYMSADACTNLLVGREASVDGSTMISYAADSYGMYGHLHFVPAADHLPGEMREVRDWDTGRPQGFIPQPAHTYSVVGNTNEYQLTIGETTWGGREQLWDTVGIDYGSLIYIALERCRTAREAIECMVKLVNEYGYASEGETFSIGDPEEIWMLDMIGRGPGRKGALWAAVRIPDDCIAAHANQARIQQLPQGKVRLSKEQKRLQKQLNCVCNGDWMYAADIIAFARAEKLFDGKDSEFSYQAAFCPYDFSGLYACEARVWSFFNHWADMQAYFDFAVGKTFAETNGQTAGQPMPLWIKPNRKLSVQEMRVCMRDQYENTAIDITRGEDAGPWHSKLRYGGLGFKVDSVHYWYPRPIATQQTAWSFISQMRSYADPKVGGIFWFGVDDAATSCYVPMYSRTTRIPECFEKGDNDSYTYNPKSAWWCFNLVANWAYTKYDRMLPDIQKVQQAWDEKFDSQIAGVDAEAARLSDDAARAFLSNYSCAQAELLVADWQQLWVYLVTKYIDGQERKEENGQWKRNRHGQPVGPNRLALPDEELRKLTHCVRHE